jgi:hypothetical protein
MLARHLWTAAPVVGAGGALAVTAGLAVETALWAIVFLTQRRRRVLSRVLAWVASIAAGNGFNLSYVPINNSWEAGVAALALPVAALGTVIGAWWAVAPPGLGFTPYLGVVTRDGDGWRVSLTRDGVSAARPEAVTDTVTAATLTGAVRALRDRVREMRSGPLHLTALQVVVLPWDHGGDYDTWYRVSGRPGHFTAAARSRERPVKGATLEEILAAVESAPGTDHSRTALLVPGTADWPQTSD